jgi:hypothetical protein
MEKYRDFMQNDDEILFVHIREPKEIDKFKNGIDGKCVTLLVRGRDEAKKEWNNKADDEVENYRYDYVYENVMELEEIERNLLPFIRGIIEKFLL